MGFEITKYFDPADKRKIAIYSRKSRFTGKGDSIGNQIEDCMTECRRRAEDAGAVLSDDDVLIFEDEGFSGGNMDRPNFKKMMKAVRDNQIKVIVCYRLDRISRNAGDFANLLNELEDLKVGFISRKDGFDTVTPTGRAMMMMVSVFSQLEREVIAERIRDNLTALAKTGRWLGGQLPTGYKKASTEQFTDHEGKIRKLAKIEQIPAEIEIVQKIFKLFIQLDSVTRVEAALREQKIRTRRKMDFTRHAVKDILTNPVYMIADKDAYEYFISMGTTVYSEKSEFSGAFGVAAYNKTKQATGKRKIFNPITEWIVAAGQHQGCVSGNDWTKVQVMIQRNSKKSPIYKKKKTLSDVSLLNGLLICGKCGAHMRHKLSDRVHKEFNEPTYDYLCLTKERTRRQECDCPRANGNILDRKVCEEVRRMSMDGSEFLLRLDQAKRQIRGKSEEQEKLLESLRAQVSKDEGLISNLVLSMATGGEDSSVPNEYVKQEITKLDQQIKDNKQKIAELEALASNHVLSDEEFNLLRNMLTSFAASFDLMSAAQKRVALGTFIDKVVWDGEKAHIYFWGSEGAVTALPSEKGSELPASEAEKGNSGDLVYQYTLPHTSPASPLCPH